jgi:Na+:H+ antiporter, NhaA family
MTTAIAFAVGVMALLGKRVPTGLKVFLAALVVFTIAGNMLVRTERKITRAEGLLLTVGYAVFLGDGRAWGGTPL